MWGFLGVLFGGFLLGFPPKTTIPEPILALSTIPVAGPMVPPRAEHIWREREGGNAVQCSTCNVTLHVIICTCTCTCIYVCGMCGMCGMCVCAHVRVSVSV